MEFNLNEEAKIKEFGANLAKDSIIMVLWEATFKHLPEGDKLRAIYIDKLKNLAQNSQKSLEIDGVDIDLGEAIWKAYKEELLKFAEYHKSSV